MYFRFPGILAEVGYGVLWESGPSPDWQDPRRGPGAVGGGTRPHSWPWWGWEGHGRGGVREG